MRHVKIRRDSAHDDSSVEALIVNASRDIRERLKMATDTQRNR
jgi:hypothetical protein